MSHPEFFAIGINPGLHGLYEANGENLRFSPFASYNPCKPGFIVRTMEHLQVMSL